MDEVIRKSLLYRSGLGFYCINHVQGCFHGCLYPCYAFMMARTHGRVREYSEWCSPRIVSNAEELLTKELKRMKSRPGEVHMCLTTDPFMNGYPEVTELSLRLIAILNSYDIRCSVLTKGKLPSILSDQSRFLQDNNLGISLISINENFREKWEPNTVSYSERIKALKALHDSGCKTYVHMEPYPTPNIVDQKLESILEKISFTGNIYFGGWNYNNIVKNFCDYKAFYASQAGILRSFCKRKGIECETGM